MKIEWLLYFIDVLSSLGEIFGCISAILCAFFIFSLICLFVIKANQIEGWEEDIQNISLCKKCCRLFLLFLIPSLIFAIFIPSKKTIYTMALAHYSKDSIIPQKVLQVIEVKLDDIIKDAKK